MTQAAANWTPPPPHKAHDFNVAKLLQAAVLALAIAGTSGGVVMYRELGEVRSTVDALAKSVERIESRLERMDTQAGYTPRR